MIKNPFLSGRGVAEANTREISKVVKVLKVPKVVKKYKIA